MNGREGPGLAFRRMREADLPRVMEIERAAFSHPWSEEMVRRELAHEFSTVLLATGGAAGEVQGFAVVWLVHDELHVLNVAVAPEARRRGVARAILDRGGGAGRASREPASPCWRCAAETPRPSRSTAPCGYREVGVRPRYYAEDGEDALVMDKDL